MPFEPIFSEELKFWYSNSVDGEDASQGANVRVVTFALEEEGFFQSSEDRTICVGEKDVDHILDRCEG